MLNSLLYNVAIELQKLGLDVYYEEVPNDNRTKRLFFINYEELNLKVDAYLEGEHWNAKEKMIHYSLDYEFKDRWGKSHYVYERDGFAINASVSKSPSRIANDIKRRLLSPSNLEQIRKTLEYMAGYEKRTAAKMALLAAVSDMTGRTHEITPDTDEVSVYNCDLPKQISRVQTYFDKGLKLELTEISLEQFKKICEALS